MKIRVVIPTLNNPFLTVGALMSLRAELPEPVDIVIVDNGSDDETRAVIRADIDQPGAGIRFIENPTLRAYSKSINMGAAMPGDWDVLLVTNNDVVFAPGSIEHMSNCIGGMHELAIPLSPRDVAGMGMSGPRVGRPTELNHVYKNYDSVCEWWEGASKHFQGVQTVRNGYLPQGGYAFMVTRNLWERLGGFDEEYELFGEDYDFFDRALRWTKIIQCRVAYVEHFEHQTVGWLGRERDERLCRSRFLLTEKREGIPEIVSVIIPTFNRTESLFEAIDSVLSQTYRNFRIYVVDDGSQDWDRLMTAARGKYAGKENQLWFFHLPKNEGPGAARNYGLDQARGKYVAFLDSDDTWHPWHLERHVEAHEREPGVVMSYSKTAFAWRWYDDETRRFRVRPDVHPEPQLRDQTFSAERLEHENFIKTSAVMISGHLLRRDNDYSNPIRFPVEPDHRLAVEDWRLFKDVAGRGPVAFIEEETARTHWSKNADADAHHSGRIVPWADFGAAPANWLAREVALPESEGATITIVTATRERPESVKKLISAIPEGIPVILVADGLGTGKQLTPLTQESETLGLLVVDEPKGPSFARNRGVESARTPWVWFIDDDDLPLPGALQWLEPHFPESDVIIGGMLVGADGGEFAFADGLYTSAMLVRCDVFQRAGGFDQSISRAEERDLFGRLKSVGARITEIPQPIVVKTSGKFTGFSDLRPINKPKTINPR